MSDIAKILGQRIRNYRTAKGLSQEKLAELSGCHPTYVGQIERGEKNATIESIEKIILPIFIISFSTFWTSTFVSTNLTTPGINIPFIL